LKLAMRFGIYVLLLYCAENEPPDVGLAAASGFRFSYAAFGAAKCARGRAARLRSMLTIRTRVERPIFTASRSPIASRRYNSLREYPDILHASGIVTASGETDCPSEFVFGMRLNSQSSPRDTSVSGQLYTDTNYSLKKVRSVPFVAQSALFPYLDYAREFIGTDRRSQRLQGPLHERNALTRQCPGIVGPVDLRLLSDD
jgi:hypothetical protein